MNGIWLPSGWVRFGIIILCLGSTIALIGYLQAVAPQYDAHQQTISELALAVQGRFLLVAFFFLGSSHFLTGMALQRSPLAVLGKALILVGLSFLMTGVVTLNISAELHILAVMLAFIFWMLSVYGFARHPTVSFGIRIFSAVTFGLVLLVGGLGPQYLSLGLVERLVLLLLMAWQVVVSYFTFVKPLSYVI